MLTALALLIAIILATPAAQAVPGTSPRTGAGEFAPGEILAIDSDPRFIPHALKFGFVLLDHVRLAALELDVVRLGIPIAANTRDALRLFQGVFPSVTADFNSLIWPAGEPRERDTGATGSWPVLRSTCGAGMRLGMIDTPVDVSHVAFRGRQVVRKSFLTGNRQPASSTHGTAIAALLVGNPDSGGFGGLLPQATLLTGNVFERHGRGQSYGKLFPLLKALDWMAAERVSVVNLSFETGENTVLSAALEKAAGRGLMLTAPAGNRDDWDGPTYPAAHPGVLTTTAVDANLRPYRYANRGSYIDFAAPGVRLWTAVPGGGAFQSGTSFAVPFLSAVTALHLANGLQPDVEQVRQALARSARDLGAPGKDDVFGWGLIGFAPDCS